MKQPAAPFERDWEGRGRCGSYYSKLFGWELSDPIGPASCPFVPRYTNADDVGIRRRVGGIPEGYDGHVTFYVEVADVEAALARAASLGGKRLLGPDQVAGGPIIGLFTHPRAT